MLSDAITDVQGIVQSLQQQYETEAHRIREALNEAEVRIAKTAWPLYLKKLQLTEDIEFIKAQLSTVEDFFKKREQDEASLNNQYQVRLKGVIESAVGRFSDYVQQRDYLLKGDQLVHIGSPEQKAAEVERFRSTFLAHAMTVYGNFRLNPTADLEALTHTLKTTLAEHETELYATDDIYVQQVAQMMDEQLVLKEHLFQKQEALRQQKMSLLSYQPTPVETLCLTNNLPALQTELGKFSAPLEYLKKVAPNALYYAAWRGSLEMVVNWHSELTPIGIQN